MTEDLFAHLIATTTGLLLITAVLQVWRQSLTASIRLLAVQGAALAGLVATLGVEERSAEVDRRGRPRARASRPWPCRGR